MIDNRTEKRMQGDRKRSERVEMDERKRGGKGNRGVDLIHEEKDRDRGEKE